MVLRMARAATLLLLAVSGAAASARTPQPYAAEITAWRAERETRLKAEGGWLSLAGLVWLKEGENTFGAGAGNDIVLPPGSAPARAGVFELRGGQASVRLQPGVSGSVAGHPVTQTALRPDTSDTPDVLSLGR